MNIYRERYNRYRWVKGIMGLAYFAGFMVIALTITDESTNTTQFLQSYGIPILLWQVAYAISGFANLIIGLFNRRWNMLWFAAWFMYVCAATIGAVQGSGIPIIPLTMYWVLMFSMITDSLHDASWGRL